MDRSPVSVVIRTFTDKNEVFDLIDGLAGQTEPPAEIVVIDSGSSESVIEHLRRTAKDGVPTPEESVIPLRLTEIANEDFDSAGALNTAIAAASGELVAIISQDALPANARYLERLASGFASPDIAGAYARQILGAAYDPLGEKDLSKTYPPRSRVQEAGDCWFVNTCSMVRRELWQRHPFDPSAQISEDHEWGKWAQSQGLKIRYEADAVARHYHAFVSLRDEWKRYYKEGVGLAYIHKSALGLIPSVFGWMRESASDAVWLLKRGKPLYWPMAVVRRAVKFAGHYIGHRHGHRAASRPQESEA